MNRLGVRRMLGAALVGGFVVVATACGSNGGGAPSCNDAIAHLYNNGCEISSNGSGVSQTDAVNGCSSIKDKIDTNGCPCGGPFNDVLDCVNGIGQNACSSCGNQWSALNSCMNGNSKC